MHVQVYDGSKAWWKEDDTCHPLNAYAASKLDGERYVQACSALSHSTCAVGEQLVLLRMKASYDYDLGHMHPPAHSEHAWDALLP